MPSTSGRFNYLTVRQDVFEVMFKPMDGLFSITVAKDLTREQAVDMMNELNEVIDDFRKEWRG